MMMESKDHRRAEAIRLARPPPECTDAHALAHDDRLSLADAGIIARARRDVNLTSAEKGAPPSSAA
jgi:hypothetical protein